MYNSKDIQFAGKHDYDVEKAKKECDGRWDTYSINVFKWLLKSNGKSMKKSACVVRVKGRTGDRRVIEKAELVVQMLDTNAWPGGKSVTVVKE